MESNKYVDQLKTIYIALHGYANNVLSDLNPVQYNWRPPDTKARTIESYFRHMVNTEIYWLHALKTHKIPYFTKDTSFSELLEHFKHLEVIYGKLLDNCTEEGLEIVPTIYEKDKGEIIAVKQKGTLAWTILRISLHAFGHMSQITHMIYSLGIKLKRNSDYNWWNTTENIINLGKLISMERK
ncbi:MAG: hypothetical protein HeimC3_09700 [Candidatus Heimdallarchaeota archaeon LC_3]|nr:MAG: hypothetical protein HeimC3_09700 [Candidatus Heimdallarchaeota archaeon LC_3]